MEDDKMRRAILASFMLIVALAATGAVSAQNIDYGVVEISFLNQDPDPAEPGRYVDLRWRVENVGTESLSDIDIELVPDFPFELDPGDSEKRNIRTLAPLQKGDTGVIVKYQARVSPDAVEGDNTLKLRYRVGDEKWSTLEYDVYVKTVDANLAIESVETVPAKLYAGERFDLKIKVKNLADSVLKDATLKLDLTLDTVSGTATGSKSDTLDSLPFAPLGSAAEKKVRQVDSGDEVIFTYELIAYPDAAAKVYKIPIQLEYYDTLETKFSKDDIIGIVVDSKPELNVLLDQTTLTAPNSRGEITIKFVNKGLTDIKFVDVRLEESELLVPLSAEEIYRGNMDSDDYETADFEVFVRDNNESEIKVPITYEYKDANNREYRETAELSLRLCALQEAELACGNGNGSSYTWVIVLVVLGIAGIIVYRVVKKRRK